MTTFLKGIRRPSGSAVEIPYAPGGASGGGGELPASIAGDDNALGFFGATPIVQPAAPETLGELIAALQDLGLIAS